MDSWHAGSPTSSVMAPVKKVAALMVSSEVPRAVAASLPASRHSPAMLLAMAERKMRPTSCTWPTASGSRGARPGGSAGSWGVGSGAKPGVQYRSSSGVGVPAVDTAKAPRREMPFIIQYHGGKQQRRQPNGLLGGPVSPEKGSVLSRQNTAWWMADDRKKNLHSWSMYGA